MTTSSSSGGVLAEIFNSHNNYVWGGSNRSCCICSLPPKNSLLSTFGLALFLTFSLGLSCYPHRFGLQIYWVSLEEILPEFRVRIPWALRRNMYFQYERLQLILHGWSENISPPLPTIADTQPA